MQVFGKHEMLYKTSKGVKSVYKITSPSGAIYIGCAKDVSKRMELRRWAYYNPNMKTSSVINKRLMYEMMEYGFENFNIEILFKNISSETALLIEKALIKYHSDIGSDITNVQYRKIKDLNRYFEEVELKEARK